MDGERKKRTLRRQQFVGLKRIAHAIDTFSVGAFDALNWRRSGLTATVVPITTRQSNRVWARGFAASRIKPLRR